MNLKEKLEVLATAAKYDTCASTSCSNIPNVTQQNYVGSLTKSGICHSYTPDGRCVSLLKVLLTNNCTNDCKYCSSNCRVKKVRTSFEEQELVDLFLKFYHENKVEGLFLSSAVGKDEEQTMELMLSVVEKLRLKEKFQGYIHLKVLPGIPQNQIDYATKLATRVSVNVESPNKSRFSELSTTKDYNLDILKRMRWIKEKAKKNSLPSGHTTQLVVGAAGESDKEIVEGITRFYDDFALKRAYFSAFQPVPETPLENLNPVSFKRENFLYRCDFLMRLYDFKKDELAFNNQDNLDLSIDPKLAAAIQNNNLFPLNLNEAKENELLRVPGIGPRSAKRIRSMVCHGFNFKNEKELRNIGVVTKRAMPFIEINNQIQSSLKNFEVM
ncbi:MAG: putative DNA modification/repair radical SAM protein [archaeon]